MELRKTTIPAILLCLLSCSVAAQVPAFQALSTEVGIEGVPNMTDQYGNGAAASDFDNDGDIDFYLATDAGIADRLYQNNGFGHFTDIAAEAGISELGSSRAALWFDYNGDHLLDLVVAGETCVSESCQDPVYLVLYQQQADHTFVDVTADAGLMIGPAFDDVPFFAIGGLAVADINQDHYLDLLFTVWGGGIKLFLNNTSGGFFDIAAPVGLIMEDKTPWQPMFLDFNQDGLIDIYCNVDFAKNKLWINQGDFDFKEKASRYGLQTSFNEMGMAVSDYDNDGDLDIYVTNISRTFQGSPRHNVLYRQDFVDGTVQFSDVAPGLGVDRSGWDWGTTFADINNNGRADLLTTNGWWNPLTWGPDTSHLWLNTAAGFLDVSDQCGFNDVLPATTLIAFDKDRDGDLDLLQTLKDNEETDAPLLIYENRLEELPYPTNYVTIQPRMDGLNHFAIGSVVTMVTDELLTTRLISAGCSFYGQEPAEAFFGLGAREAAREIIVRWPTNEISIYPDVPLNQSTEVLYEVITPPTDLLAELEEKTATLSWQDNSDNESGFVIYRSLDSTFMDFENMVTLEAAADATSYVDSSLQAGTQYFYRIRAGNDNVLSDNSNKVSIETEEEVIPVPEGTGTFIYPNPLGNNELTIKSFDPYLGPVRFRLFDQAGHELLTEATDKTTEFAEFHYPILLPAGLYLLRIEKGETNQWHKVVVSRQ